MISSKPLTYMVLSIQRSPQKDRMPDTMGNRLGLESQTLFGMPPVEHIELAAELGCGHVSLGPAPVPWKLDRFPQWSLMDDPALQRATRSALRDTGVRFALAEGFIIRPGVEARDRVAEFDLIAELGAERASAASMDPDANRALDQLAVLAELAAARKIALTFEFAPPHTFNTLASAIEAVRKVGQSNTRLLIDVMHLVRTGSVPGDLAQYSQDTFGYAQVSDAPLMGDGRDYYLEASFERKVPGEGELPLLEILAALPRDIPVGLEVPMQRDLTAADDLRVPIKRIVDAGKRLLAELESASD
jgi:sugar phosphate isomerase/epimerase